MWRCTFCLFLLILRIDGKRAKRTHEMHLRAPTSANINWQTICDVRKKIFLSLDFDLFSEFGLFGKFRWHSGEVRKVFKREKLQVRKKMKIRERLRRKIMKSFQSFLSFSLNFLIFRMFSPPDRCWAHFLLFRNNFGKFFRFLIEKQEFYGFSSSVFYQ